MSYCVNCGVELDAAEAACPLCGTDVVNPNQPFDASLPRPYPERMDPVNARLNRRFAAAIVTIILMFPAVLAIAINYIYQGEPGWGLYIAGSVLLLWVMSVPIFIWRRITFLRLFVPDVLALLAFMRFFEFLHPGRDWFWRLAFPLVAIGAGITAVIGILISKKVLRSYYTVAAVFLGVAILVPAIELLSEKYVFDQTRPEWSLYVAIPCVAIAAVLMVVARRRNLREEINRRIHL